MPIFDQGYQHWNGRFSSHAWRWLAVTRQGVRQQIGRRWWTKWLVAAAFVPGFVLAGVLIFWGLFEQQSALLQPIMSLLQALPDAVRNGPKEYRLAVWTFAFDWFFRVETFFSMLLVLAVGPDLVSQDLRFNALPLYFSRPVRRFDYFLGKLGVIAFFLAIVAIGPAMAAYAIGVAFSLDLSVLRDTWKLLLGSILYGVVVTVSAGMLMLAISSLSRNSRLVGATWVGLWIVSSITAEVLMVTVEQPWCPLVSYSTNLQRMREEVLDMPGARGKFLALWESGREARERAARTAVLFGGLNRGRQRGRRPPVDPNATPPGLETPEHLKHPWTWSGGVLGGLFVASLLTLSTRVKSMDRLK
ncbi:MAG: ABC transporter permease subunit [Isosphaeraceae bacterium]